MKKISRKKAAIFFNLNSNDTINIGANFIEKEKKLNALKNMFYVRK